MTTARGVLKRHCAIGKTPLLAAPVQSPPGLPECGSAGVSACTPPTVVCPMRIPRATGAITDALGSLSYALNAGAAMLALAAIATAFQGRLARKS